jgi:hypothetical protein
MDTQELDNWRKIKTALEVANTTDNHFYKRAVSILSGGGDYMSLPPLDNKDQ